MPNSLRWRVMILVAIATSCSRGEPPTAQRGPDGEPLVEVVHVDELPSAVREMAIEVSEQQAAAGAGASAELYAAWNYAPPPALDPADDAKLVAVELQLDIPGTGFDLDDIDIIDADTQQNYGSNPILQRLTSAGKPVAFEDPEVASDNHHFRMLGIWAVPRKVRRIELGYWNAPLSKAIEILDREDGPRSVDEVSSVVAYHLGERESPEQIHHLWIECNWSRVSPPPSYQLAKGDELLHDTRAIAVDEKGAPLTTPVQQRPYYGRFGWVLEYRAPPDTKFDEINQFGERTRFPDRTFEPSAALVDALARLPAEG